MGRVFFGVAALFFFLAAVGSHIVPNATAWGFVLVALGLAASGVPLQFWRQRSQ